MSVGVRLSEEEEALQSVLEGGPRVYRLGLCLVVDAVFALVVPLLVSVLIVPLDVEL